ncbi:hypothetical protein ACVWZD_005967 [Streptomyces sp. TE3672]
MITDESKSCVVVPIGTGMVERLVMTEIRSWWLTV